MFDKSALGELLHHEADTCVSIFMPSHPGGPGTRQDPIRLRNLIGNARRRLGESGLRPPQCDDLLRPAVALLDDSRFWQHAGQGLALFLAPGFSRTHTLPLPLHESVAVDSRFHVGPLLPLLARDGRFFLLAVNQTHVWFHEGSRYALRRVHDAQLPTGVEEILARTELSAELGYHGSGGGAGAANARYHSLGDSPEDYLQQEVAQFAARLAKAVDAYLTGRDAPLVLAAEPRLQGLFRRASDYRQLAEQGIDKNPAALDERALHAEAYAIVAPLFDRSRTEALARLSELAGAGDARAGTELEPVLLAAAHARVDTLFLVPEVTQGRTGETAPDPELADRLDRAAAETLRSGGTVHAVGPAELPNGQVAAAILRY